MASPAPSPSSSAEDAGLAYGGLGLTGVGMGAAYGGAPAPGVGLSGISGSAILPPVEVALAITADKADSKLLEKQGWRFKACAAKARASDPTTSGTVTLEATIATDGTLAVTSSKRTGTLPEAFELCARSTLDSRTLTARAAIGTCTVVVTVKPDAPAKK